MACHTPNPTFILVILSAIMMQLWWFISIDRSLVVGTYYLKMHEHSSNHSSRSNLFALSQSSYSRSHKPHKGYSSFVKKIKHLLEAQGDDLEQLYQKVQVVVKKYFRDNKIVEFSEMYDHIVCLRSNSKQMTEIVNLLERKIINQSSNKKKVINPSNSDRIDQFQITSSTQKETKPSLQKLEGQEISSSGDTVINSIKYNFDIKPSQFKKQHTEQTEQTQTTEVRRPKIKVKQQKKSQDTGSPSKRSASFQEYLNRNKQYNAKVQQLMQELTSIKQNLPTQSQHTQHQQVELQILQQEDRMPIELEESFQEIKVEDRQELVPLYPNHKMGVTTQTDFEESKPSINKESVNLQTKNTNFDTNQDYSSSTTELARPQQQQSTNEQRGSRPQNSRTILLQQATLITKQLEDLKAVAFMLQEQSSSSEKQQQVKMESLKTQYMESGQSKIQELVRQQRDMNFEKEEYLQKISNTSSKMQITQEMIPSFKRLDDRSYHKNQPIFHHPTKMVDSSVFSFSNNNTQPVLMVRSQHPNTGSRDLPSNRSTSSKGHQIPLQVSVVKHGYNPYFHNPRAERVRPPSIHFQREEPQRRSISNQNRSMVVSPSWKQNKPAQMVKFHPQQIRSNVSIATRPSSKQRRYPHLQQQEKKILIDQFHPKQIKSAFSYSNPSSINNNSSSFQRRGINLISPPPFMP